MYSVNQMEHEIVDRLREVITSSRTGSRHRLYRLKNGRIYLEQVSYLKFGGKRIKGALIPNDFIKTSEAILFPFLDRELESQRILNLLLGTRKQYKHMIKICEF